MNTIVLLLPLFAGVVAVLNTRPTRITSRLNYLERKSLQGLFLNKEKLIAIANRDKMKAPIYRLKDFSVLFEYGASCSPTVYQYMKCKNRPSIFTGRTSAKTSARTSARASASITGAFGRARLTTQNPCCDTNTIMVQPNTVTGVDSLTYEVVQDPDSVQIVHLGTCNSITQGNVCSNAGFCTQQYRMQWILVHTSQTHKQFVPVEMHNHCVCNFV